MSKINIIAQKAKAIRKKPIGSLQDVRNLTRAELPCATNLERRPNDDIIEISIENCSFNLFKKKSQSLPENASIKDLDNFKEAFNVLRKKAQHSNKINEFCDSITDLSISLMKSKTEPQKDLGQIYCSELIKIQTKNGNYSKAINLAEISLTEHEKDKDLIHCLGRLHLLQDLYELTNQKSKRYATLLKANTCVNRILENYDNAKNNYKTLSVSPKTKEVFYKEKAYICSQLAKTMAHKKRNKAIQYLLEVKSIYEKLGMKQELFFVIEQLKRLKTSIMTNKLKKYTASEVKTAKLEKIFRADKRGEPINFRHPSSLRRVDEKSIAIFNETH